MAWYTVEILPDEVLGVILKLVADSPMNLAAPPTPIVAARVNRRWRSITLSYPELWTTIRISHRPHSLRWASISLACSRTLPIDISINLEACLRNPNDVERSMPPP
ncbi:hypothetical protein FB45DRAFT_932739 [Roridomyces roridus]|uniref:F-box domain-containing protein n=1 Tax=Roridomyces roridus TaxID=1738132 RepID=A0AAD7BDT5_9AGAR|nr:hypothetical protein FB45DRAFT_932739 [Roridomyces roridus]